jgi:Family of unknown function (DUF5681)
MSKVNDESRLPQDEDSVGYGRPPKSTRFKKGESGNPRGRPKGSLNTSTLLMRTMKERVVINENGQRKAVPKIVAIFKRLINNAVSGDPRAQKMFLELLSRDEAQQQLSRKEEIALDQFDQQTIESLQQHFANMPLESEIEEDEQGAGGEEGEEQGDEHD